jgi:hypothetical protein
MVGRYHSEEDIAPVFSVHPPPQGLSPCTADKRHYVGTEHRNIPQTTQKESYSLLYMPLQGGPFE